MRLQNQIALITGAGSGIGRVIAVALAHEGAQVHLAGRRRVALEETAAQIHAQVAGVVVTLHEADISVSSSVEELVETILRAAGPIDILINNAGVFPPKRSVAQTTVADWDATLATNLRGPFLLIRAVLPGMIERDYGRILNISAPLKHLPQASAYCASKMGLDSLTKTTAFELRGKNILVNAIEPPLCDTEMHTGGKSPEVVVETVLRLVEPGLEPTQTGRIVKIE